MKFTRKRRVETNVFTTTDPAGRQLANGCGEGRRVVAASVYTVEPARYYDPDAHRMVIIAPMRWSAAIEMDTPNEFGDRGIHGGIHNERDEAEGWIAAMLGERAEKSGRAEGGPAATQQAPADRGRRPSTDERSDGRRRRPVGTAALLADGVEGRREIAVKTALPNRRKPGYKPPARPSKLDQPRAESGRNCSDRIQTPSLRRTPGRGPGAHALCRTGKTHPAAGHTRRRPAAPRRLPAPAGEPRTGEQDLTTCHESTAATRRWPAEKRRPRDADGPEQERGRAEGQTGKTEDESRIQP